MKEGQGHAVADITRQHNVSEARPLPFELAHARGAYGRDQAFLHCEEVVPGRRAKKCCALQCRKDRDTLRLTQSVINNISEAGPLPFELRVLEALLDETARQFERRQRRLELLAMSIEDDIQKTLKQNAADLQRLLPIQRWPHAYHLIAYGQGQKILAKCLST